MIPISRSAQGRGFGGSSGGGSGGVAGCDFATSFASSFATSFVTSFVTPADAGLCSGGTGSSRLLLSSLLLFLSLLLISSFLGGLGGALIRCSRMALASARLRRDRWHCARC